VTARVRVYRFDGTLDHELDLPGLGMATGFDGSRDEPTVFYTFSSLDVPDTIYREDRRY
jgi:prolyl oligopeptidase